MSSSLPCPLCSTPLDIRKSVRGKPYTVCDRCGMQMFIRKEAGIIALKKLLANGATDLTQDREKLRQRIGSLEQELARKKAELESAHQTEKELPQIARRLQDVRAELAKARSEKSELEETLAEHERALLRTCPKCGEEFRVREDLIQTSWFDGRFEGYRCPREECGGTAPPLKEN